MSNRNPNSPWYLWLQQRKRDKRASNDKSPESDMDDRLQAGFDALAEDDVEENRDMDFLSEDQHEQ